MKPSRFHLRLSLVVAAALLMPATSTAQGAKKNEPAPPSDEMNPMRRKEPVRKVPYGMKLPAGYEHKGGMDFEGTISGEIWKKDGLKIEYVAGPLFGQIVTPRDKDVYLKYWEQVVSGRTVRFGFTGEALLISLPLDDAPDTISGANFRTAVKKIEDAADMVTIALSMIREDKPEEKPTR